MSILQKAIWALSLCPVDAVGAPVAPLSILEGWRMPARRDELARAGREAVRQCFGSHVEQLCAGGMHGASFAIQCPQPTN